MSPDHQTSGPSTDNFTQIINAALNEYQTVTGKRLDTHPFATQLNTCHTPEAVLTLFQTQAEAFRKSRQGDEKLMKWLDPTVHILFTLSATLGEGVGLVSLSFILFDRSLTLGFSHSLLRRRSLQVLAYFSGYVIR